MLTEKSAEEILSEISQLSDTGRILDFYKQFKNGETLENVLWNLKQEAQR